jgi:hypothetical protein
VAAQAAHAEAPYLDDRSDPSALVRSLYNAINRKEYARAYSYFSVPPAQSLEKYAAGYADTESVEVLIGAPGEEGAAGSVYFQVPAVIDVTTAARHDRQIFAGCYTVRKQNVPDSDSFTPLQIEKGSFKPVEGDPADLMPTSCGDGGDLPKVDVVLETAKKSFAGSYSALCQSLAADADPAQAEPETYIVPMRSTDKEASGDPVPEGRLFRFFCQMGAYNETHVYYFADSFGEVTPVQFSEPELDIRYENNDHEAGVEEINIIGYVSRGQLVNSFYDANTLTVTSYAKWRGVGDASSSGTWLFRNGAFTLVKFEVDASYDEQMNPETVLDFSTGP